MISFFLITVVAAFAALVFTVWMTVVGTRSLWRLVAGEVRAAAPDTAAGPRCGNSGCGTVNPSQARFCRRCGSTMGASVQASTCSRARSVA